MNGPGVVTDPPVMGWIFQIVGPLVWLALAVYVIQQCRQRRHLTRNALVLIATTTMWWQEWFGDWGAYIIYNPHFALMPWGSTLWTTPNKPWAVILAYGWYYTLSFLAFFWLVDKLRARRPDIRPWVACVVIGIPVFYLADLIIEGGAAMLGMWSYDHYVGPALASPAGNFPLLYPVLFFTAWCALQASLVYSVDAQGFTPFDRLFGLHRWLTRTGSVSVDPNPSSRGGGVATADRTEKTQLSASAQAVRALIWAVGFNASYWVVFIFPVVLIRIITGPTSTLIP